jgi:hypothetical protein
VGAYLERVPMIPGRDIADQLVKDGEGETADQILVGAGPRIADNRLRRDAQRQGIPAGEPARTLLALVRHVVGAQHLRRLRG